jgi:hypothetical protein
MALGTTTSFGTGDVLFSLPVTSSSSILSGSGYVNNPFIGQVHMVDTGTQEYGGWIVIATSTTMKFSYNDVSASGRIQYASGGSSRPFGWGNGDIISGWFDYEAA